MFKLNRCKCEGCTKQALSSFDEQGNILETEGWCLEHHPEPEKAANQIRLYIRNHEKIVGLCGDGITISDVDLKEKKFYGCSFMHCSLTSCHSSRLRMRMCNFDFSTFTDCDFVESNIQFTSLTGTKLVHVLFTGSDLIHNNFNGVTAYQTSFDDSDLYNSRFIKAVLITVSMNNCNLKKTIFYGSVQDNVSFKLSNTREALMIQNKGSFISDIRNSASRDESGDLKL